MQEGLNSRLDNQSTVRGFFSLYSPHNVIINAIIYAYFFLVSAGGIPIRLLMRKNMGERAFSPLGFLTSFLFYLISGSLIILMFMVELSECFNFLKNHIGVNFFEKTVQESIKSIILLLLVLLVNPYTIFLYIFVRLGIFHFKRSLSRAKQKQLHYSLYRGDGIFFEKKKDDLFMGHKIDDVLIRMIIEPLAVLKLAMPAAFFAIMCAWIVEVENLFFLNLLIEYFLIGLSITLIAMSFSSICIFLEEFGIMMKLRNSVLDMIDGEVDMQVILKLKEETINGANTERLNNNFLSLSEENGNEIKEVKNIATLND